MIADKTIEAGIKYRERVEAILDAGVKAFMSLGMTEHQSKAQIISQAIQHVAVPLYSVRDSAQELVKVGDHFQCDNSTVFLVERAKGIFTNFDPVEVKQVDEATDHNADKPSHAIRIRLMKIGEEVKDFAGNQHASLVANGMNSAHAWISTCAFLLDTVAKPIYKLKEDLVDMEPTEWTNDVGEKWEATEMTEKLVKFRRTSYIRTKTGAIDTSGSGRLSIKRAEELGYTVINNR